MTGRWDPSYFRPELVALEKRVRKVTRHRLRDFVLRTAGGATPSTRETETHYTAGEGGVPFIRVQNLSTTGCLNLDECKYITRTTHEGLLGRSKLSGGELLVKITGVGRMAVASVVPEDFEANINQHIVAIRTKDKKTSETLAAWLNLDTAERLASRRSTGGTRPALDYLALLSIPVVFDERLPRLVGDAVATFQECLSQAAKLLASIDEVLLHELGIQWKQEPSTIETRIFRRTFNRVTGNRFDAHYHRPAFENLTAKLRSHPHTTLGKLANLSSELWDQKSDFNDVFPYVEIGSVDLTLGKLSTPPLVSIAEAASRARMLIRPGDLLVSLTRPTRRAICIVPSSMALAVASNGFSVIRSVDEAQIVRRYLFYVLRSRICTAQFDQRSSGGSYPAITEDQLLKLIIPLPNVKMQSRIVVLLDAQYEKADAMLATAHSALESAKHEIEALILGETSS